MTVPPPRSAAATSSARRAKSAERIDGASSTTTPPVYQVWRGYRIGRKGNQALFFQSFGSSPAAPLTGSDCGKGREAMRRTASSDGALRQMSQFWFGGYAPTTRK